MTDCEIKLRVRPWPSRLVRLYKANRSIGFGRLQALSMAWALTWCAWPMTTLKFIARSASAGLTGYVGALAIYVATVGAPDDATIAGGDSVHADRCCMPAFGLGGQPRHQMASER